ncbi:Fes1-domain-containing protein [Neolentinus lepideus HHB14362 ss-1]|uniref:Fes1-domain-containing protein n=1 Tax=Neolentinus lepideus HHB14362 ss-1 TaxID=1314782 RepID=A0A165PND9_9AGAM|nr:Fes1-domain-containing protein [Neolentinus lepideus HHB14362 ss-1]
MQSLLRWSIEHGGGSQNQQDGERPDPKKLDPEIIDMILGKPDSVQMKEKLAIAIDESKSEDERVEALDDFEMLIESIDNANDLEKLNMWQPLHELLTAPGSTDEIKRQVLWIIGTAVQNNPAAQNVFLSMSPIQTILSFFAPTVPAQTRSKAVYALSGALKHNAEGVRQLDAAGGWDIIRNALEDSDISVRRKTVFLINILLIPTYRPVIPGQYQRDLSSGISTATATTLHASSFLDSPSTYTSLHTPDSPSAPVHPNSHATLQFDPMSMDTSSPTFDALHSKGLLSTLINGLTSPVPYGEDGEMEGDIDFAEQVVRLLETYVSACRGTFTGEEKRLLKGYFEKEGTDGEKYGLSDDEMRMLIRALE